MRTRLGFLLVVKLVRFDWNSLWGGCSQMYQARHGTLACRILDDDYVIGYTVDDDFYCVTFDMHAARVLLMPTS